jgi:hypothetical protein
LKPEQVVDLIKLGDFAGLKKIFESADGVLMLEKLNLLVGYEDPDYVKVL